MSVSQMFDCNKGLAWLPGPLDQGSDSIGEVCPVRLVGMIYG